MSTVFKKLTLSNSITSRLTADPLTSPLHSKTPRQVQAHFSFVTPDPVPTPQFISINHNLEKQLGFHLETTDLAELAGNEVRPTATPLAYCYGGHQFGSWAGQLGDGRAITLFQSEINGNMHEFQLKGAGKTPYSRFSDGLAVTRSSIREYLASEAMFALDVPTSRCLALVGTGKQVQRETVENGAIVCRVAPSWIRFGSFEILYARDDVDGLKKLLDYTIDNFFNGLSYIGFLGEVVQKTAVMIAHWQAEGFCHGVMNTDNFSVLGKTIDYGPFQFLDAYDTSYICNHSDGEGRYAFNEQPSIALWNLIRLATALSPLLKGPSEGSVSEIVKPVLDNYVPILRTKYNELMFAKFGYKNGNDNIMKTIIEPMLMILEEGQIDYSQFMRRLSHTSLLDEEISRQELSSWMACSYLSADILKRADETGSTVSERLVMWYKAYRNSQNPDPESESSRQLYMLSKNPKYILKNHFVQLVIEKVENGDVGAVDRYLKVLQNPFDEGSAEEEKQFFGLVPAFSRNLKCSCSS